MQVVHTFRKGNTAYMLMLLNNTKNAKNRFYNQPPNDEQNFKIQKPFQVAATACALIE